MNSYRSIKSKVLLPLFVSLSIIFVIFQIYSNYLFYQEDKDQRLEHIQILSTAIASNLQASIMFEDTDSAQEQLNTFSADKNILQVTLTLVDGTLFSEYKNDSEAIHIETNIKAHIDQGFYYGKDNFHVFTPVTLDRKQLGLLHIISENDFLDSAIDKALNVAVFLLILLLSISFYLFTKLNNLIVNPVANLKNSMSNFLNKKDDFKPLKVNQQDELGDLVNGFNTMLARLATHEKKIKSTLFRLEEEKVFAEELIDSVQHGLFLVDNTGLILHCNPAGKALFDGEDILKTCIQNLFEQAEQECLILAINEVQHLQQQTFFINRNMINEKVLSISSNPQNKVGSVIFAIDDITDSYHANYRQQLAAGVFENSQDGILVINADGEITMTNPALHRLLGFSEAEMLGQLPEKVLDWQNFRSNMNNINDSVDNFGTWQGELCEKHHDGRVIPMFVKANKIASQTDSGDLVFILSDLSNVKEVERLEYLAHHDSLTGLINRSKLYTQIESLLQRNKLGDFSILFLDLDGFKCINDTHGHDAGDQVLKVVAKRLTKLVRNSDLVCRLAGDEFVILVVNNSDDITNVLAKRMLDAIAQPITFNDSLLQIGVSIGVHRTQKGDVTDTESLLKLADLAMYEAKSLGKSRIVHSG